jgi:hypothetical protein
MRPVRDDTKRFADQLPAWNVRAKDRLRSGLQPPFEMISDFGFVLHGAQLKVEYL